MTTFADADAPEVEVGLAASEPGPRVVAPFGRRQCAVVANEAAGEYRLLTVSDPAGPTPLPGQFYMLAAVEGWGGGEGERPYLARAFSVCVVTGERLGFLVDDIGPGTARLAALVAGDGMWLVGPLGVGFSAPADLPGGERVSALLLGGGIGIAPLVVLSEALASSGVRSRALLGFRSSRYADSARLVQGDVLVATDDGSAGHHGFVTELLEFELRQESDRMVYACGPPNMLEAVRAICFEHSVPAQLALEESMACGFGACYGCAVQTTTGYRRICVDGPVVSAADLDEEWLRD